MGLSAPVSIDSVGLRKWMPRDTSSWIERTQCATLRPHRSSFQTNTASNFRNRASRRSWSSRGRLACAPLKPVSTYSAKTSQPRLATYWRSSWSCISQL